MPDREPLVIDADYIEQVFHLITNKDVVDFIKEAETKYSHKDDSWIKQQVYGYVRARGNEVRNSIATLEKTDDNFSLRLRVVNDLLTKGGWESNSFNVKFFKAVIPHVKNFKPILEENIYSFIIDLKAPILKKINLHLAKDVQLQNERLTTQTEQQKRIENVVIHKNLDEAKIEAATAKDKSVFYLQKSDTWTILMVDPIGNTHPLTSLPVTMQYLKQKTELDQLKPLMLNKIKEECLNAREKILKNIKLMVNPEQNDQELIKNGETFTFILRQTEQKNSLWWIDHAGSRTNINLRVYPELEQWLEQRNPVQENEQAKLKFYLMKVDTRRALPVGKIAHMNRQLEGIFAKKAPKTAHPSEESAAASRLRLLINPVEDNSELAEKGKLSTFILRQVEHQTSLWWLNSLGSYHKIDLQTYTKLSQWLENNPDLTNEENIAQLKTYLVEVKTSQAISEESKSKLAGLLANKFNAVKESPKKEEPVQANSPTEMPTPPKRLTTNHYRPLEDLFPNPETEKTKQSMEQIEDYAARIQ